jgi:hypothetical protein
MTSKRKPATVREAMPVQVYLAQADQTILERTARVMGLPRAEILRRGLRRFAAEQLADESPALAFLEIAAQASPHELVDVAERHDEYLADWEMASWDSSPVVKKAKTPRK